MHSLATQACADSSVTGVARANCSTRGRAFTEPARVLVSTWRLAMRTLAEHPVLQAALDRLQLDEGLHLPSRFLREHPDGYNMPRHIRDHLSDLIRAEPGVFLERYGARLTVEELRPFNTLPGVLPQIFRAWVT